MAAAPKSSPSAGQQTQPPQQARAAPAQDPAAELDEARWQPVLTLPCRLTIDLPLPDFKVADFLRLRRGTVVSTHWRLSREVPVRVNGALDAWGELEGAGNQLAIRLTELA